MTKVLRINPKKPNKNVIARAVQVLKSGGTVIFPTETVYGIGADPFNEKAVNKVFRMKGRSFHKPLAVIVSNAKEILPLVEHLTPLAKRLIKKYMPGPMTLILKKSAMIPDIVTAGEKTIGIRMPDHKIARMLLKEIGSPIVATSANRSGYAPATTAAEALKQIKGADLVLCGGKTTLGEASTVVDLSGKKAKILRQGTLKITS